MLLLLVGARDEDRLHAEPTGGDRCGEACVRDRHLLDKGSYIHTGKARAAELFRNLQSLITLLDRFIINCLRPFAGNIVFLALLCNFFVTEIFNVLQEILTVKSDDVEGRVKTYEAIVKGEPIPQPGIPESFRVMLKELQSLGLDVVVQDKEGNEIDMRQNFDDEETGFDMRDVAGTETVANENELLNDYTIKDADAGFDDPSVLEDDNSAAAESASDEVNIDE